MVVVRKPAPQSPKAVLQMSCLAKQSESFACEEEGLACPPVQGVRKVIPIMRSLAAGSANTFPGFAPSHTGLKADTALHVLFSRAKLA